MTQIIALTSFNHLSGKTLIAAHLAVMLAKDYKTAVFEEANKQSSLSEFIAKHQRQACAFFAGLSSAF